MMVHHRRLHFTTFDLMAALPLIALGLLIIMSIAWYLTPNVETFSILRARPLPPAIVPDRAIVSNDVAAARAYLHSRETARAISNDPRMVKRQRPWSVDDLQQKLRQDLRIEIIPRTYLLKIAMRVEAPNRDTAILNAAVNTYLMGPGKGRFKLIELARAPRLSPASYRSRVEAATVASILVLIPMALLVARLGRHLLSRRTSQAIPPSGAIPASI